MKFPEKLSDISLNKYQLFLNIEEPNNEDLVKCLLGISFEQLSKFKAAEVDALIIHFKNLLNEDTPFKNSFELNGVTYGFIPDLDQITYGENKDITSYIGDFKNMHKAMAVAFRPIIQKKGSRYIIEPYEGSHKYSETMKEAPLDVVLGMMVFFYSLTNALLKAIPNYLEKELTKQTSKASTSVENGEVIASYIHSLREILGDLAILQKQVYTPV